MTHLLRLTILAAGVIAIGSCANQQQSRNRVDPDVARARIAALIPAKTASRDAWAADIFTAFESLKIEPSKENACAVIAVIQQESTFRVDPTVPGLPGIARREINARADRLGIPDALVSAALRMRSPDGRTYEERLAAANTEKALSEIFEDFIGSVPLGTKLFADWNPVRTGGPMQVSVAYAERHSKEKRYPYPVPESIRREVFTRRGGLYFGIAHLLDYPAPYRVMVYRFADFNAGHYASRNAAFQNAVNAAGRKKLALDGDLLIHDGGTSNTEQAVRELGPRLELSDAQIHRDLEKGGQEGFESTRTWKRVFELADQARPKPVPRAMAPRIRLESAKITRKLTTDWFANRVNGRYDQCLTRGASPRKVRNP